MNNTISSNAPFIDYIYSEYIRGRYIVNRRYQRKLVWTIEEKRSFIDSLFQHYSVPILLFAKNNSNKEDDKLEIIDGLQRLNAIFSFIENDFGIVDDKGIEWYFDLQTLGTTKGRLDEGVIEQKTPILSVEKCRAFSQYPLPISEFSADNESIEEVFRRINSFGRKLSPQEIRQAGALCKFSDIVRILASKIRGDVSTNDTIPLEQMSKISLSNRHLKYGIDIRKMFWTKQNIIPESNIRVSRDEELIASILIYILLGSNINPSANNLDKLYQYNPLDVDALSTRADDALNKLGFDNVSKYFIQTYDLLQTVFKNTKVDIREWIEGSKMFKSFQIVFLAVYELYINKNLQSVDTSMLLNKFKKIGRTHLNGIENAEWNGEYRAQKITAIEAIIAPAFKRLNGEDVARENWTSQLENLLIKSQTEGTQYDFKMGCYALEANATFNEEMIIKCVQRLAAMTNKGPHIKGYVIIGVGESESSLYQSIYGTNPIKSSVTHFLVNGVQDEVKKYCGNNFDLYERQIKKAINKSKAEDYVKIYITQHMKNVEYYGKTVIVLELEAENGPILYDEKIYIRSGSDLDEVTDYKSLMAITDRFKIQK